MSPVTRETTRGYVGVSSQSTRYVGVADRFVARPGNPQVERAGSQSPGLTLREALVSTDRTTPNEAGAPGASTRAERAGEGDRG